MKRLLAVSLFATTIALSGCGVFDKDSTTEPTIPEQSENVSEPDPDKSDPDVKVDKDEENSPTFILRTNCSDGMKDCDQTDVILYHDSTTSIDVSVDENLIDQYKEAERDSILKDAKTVGKDNCGTDELGVKVPEWGNKELFFCEYENGERDHLNLVTQKVLEESGVLIVDPAEEAKENDYADGNS